MESQVTQMKVQQQITGNLKQTHESEIYSRQYLNILIKFFGYNLPLRSAAKRPFYFANSVSKLPILSAVTLFPYLLLGIKWVHKNDF